MNETTLPGNSLDLGMQEQAQSNIQERIPGQVQPYQTQINTQSEPMFGLTFPRLSTSSSYTGRGNDLVSNLSRPSHSFSAMMRTSPLARSLSPLNSTSQKSTLLKQVSKVKESEKQDLNLEVPNNWHTSSLLNDEDTMMEDLVPDIPHLRQNLMMKETGSEESFDNRTCLGMDDMELRERPKTPAVLNQPVSSGSSTETSNQQSSISNLHLMHQEGSRCQNGSMYSRENPSTSTKYSRHSTALQLIQRERLALEKQKSVLEELKQSGRLKQVLSGLQRGDPL